MADNKFFNNQDVYVETSYDNIIIVDPNKVNSDKTVSERLVNQEELVMYASLEAKVIPRSKLVVGDNFDDTIKNIRVGAVENDRNQVINFMKTQPKNKSGEIVEENFFDTSWTDNLTLGKTRNGDVDSQLLGITNISIKINTSFAALVTIEMEDVQGRVLFEQGENSPYSAFFQFPYPLFTLTVKGYYGKAIQYELMLKDFNAKFDPASGNYKITTNYISRTYALLSDITIDSLYALPHMYQTTTEFGPEETTNQSTVLGQTQQNRVINSTRGYDMLKNVYSSYKQKGLIDEDFPELTLNQMIMKLENFDRFVMEAYGKEDFTILNNMRDYYKKIQEFRRAIYGNIRENWQKNFLDDKVIANGKPMLYEFKKDLGGENKRIEGIQNAINELKSIIEKYNNELNSNETFGTEGECKIGGEVITNSLTSNINIKDFLFVLSNPSEQVNFEETYTIKNKKSPTEVQLESFKSKFLTDYEVEKILIKTDTLEVIENELSKTYIIFGDYVNKNSFSENSFLKKLQELEGKFEERKLIVEEALSKSLAEKIKSDDVGLGFNPTIKNVMAIICASADAFLRLMDKVHEDAWEQRKNPVRIGAVLPPEKSQSSENTMVQSLLSGLSTYSVDGENKPTVYPWPQYYVESVDADGNVEFEDRYPGDPSVISQVQGWRSEVWPEIRFVEEYIKGVTQKDTVVLNYDYENELKDNPFIGCNAIEFPLQQRPYSDLNIISYIYELFERTYLNSNYTKMYRSGGYGKELYSVFGDFEFNNINNSIVTSPELLELFKNFAFSYENILRYMRSISNNGEGAYWNQHIRGIFATPYIRNLVEKSFGVYNDNYLNTTSTKVTSDTNTKTKLIDYLKSNQSDQLTFLDSYPYDNLNWVKKNLSEGSTLSSVVKSNDTSKMFTFNEDKKTIASFGEPSDSNLEYAKKPFTYFGWVNENSESPVQNNPNIENNIQNNQTINFETNTIIINYYENKTDDKMMLTESFIDYGRNYNTTVNNLTSKQTTSLINTPYFINSILKGVENEKNNVVNPYVGLGYIYLNSLPLSTLREKFKNFTNGTETNLNYIFATLNKYASIHKLPTLWIAKYGAIWHRYKRYKNDNIDILDGIWEDFDYVNAYDPNTQNVTKKYNFKNYDNTDVEIQQHKNTIQQYQIDLGQEYIPPIELVQTVTETQDLMQNGFYPKVINDVYYYVNKVDLLTGYTSTDIQTAQSEKNLKIGRTTKGTFEVERDLEKYTMCSWTQFVETKNNTDFQDSENDKVLIIPSFGDVKFNQSKFETITESGKLTQDLVQNSSVYNGGVRSLWSASNYGYFSNDLVDRPTPEQYLKYIDPTTTNKQSFNLGNNTSVEYSSIEDIFGVFTKEILDNFEEIFLNFCELPSKFDINFINRGQTTFEEFLESDEVKGQYPNGEIPSSEYNSLRAIYQGQQSPYSSIDVKTEINLHKIIQSILITDKPNLTGDFDTDIKNISKNQFNGFKFKHQEIYLKDEVVLKIGNPGKFDTRIYGSLTDNDEYKVIDPINFGNYVNNSLPISGGTTTLQDSINTYPEAWRAMYEYVGDFSEENIIYSDNGSYLTDFFVDMGFEFSESNVELLAPLIKIYAGQKKNNNNITKQDFIDNINQFLNEQQEFQTNMLNHIFINANRKLKSVAITEETNYSSKLDGNVVKLELWKTFQAMNDKWVAGQDFKTRTIFEDFLFLDRANRPVGDKVIIDITSLVSFIKNRRKVTSLYSLLGDIYEENNFVFIPTPAYTNFYGRNERVKEGEPIPQDIPNDLFGTFMEVDTRDSRPRMLGVYIGEPSSSLNMNNNNNSRKGDDSFDITIPSTCPLKENQQNKTNYSDSNACVGFQVDFGKRNQGIFSSISVDMNQHKNIGPTFLVLEDLGSQASGQKVAQQSQSFYQFYKTRSYTCQIQSLGNAMIQPTMYFNLTNVPLFYGPYLIMNVSHNISNRGFTTNFDGVRIPKNSLQMPDKLVASINRDILLKLEKKLKQQSTNGITGSSINAMILSNPDKTLKAGEEKCKSLTAYGDKPFTDLLQTPIRANDIITHLNSYSNLDNDIKVFLYGISTLNTDVRQNCYNNNLIALPTNKKLTPENRSDYFGSQTCVDSDGKIYALASFDSIGQCLDYMFATFERYGGSWIQQLKDRITQTTTTDPTAKSLATLYMSQIYDRIPMTNLSAPQVYEIVNTKVNDNTEYKKEFDRWVVIFKSVINKVS